MEATRYLWCHVSVHLFSCDPGFTGSLCVPENPLPMRMKDDFELGINSKWWPEVHGADVTMPCDVVTAGQSLSFYQVGSQHGWLFAGFTVKPSNVACMTSLIVICLQGGVRMAVTQDLDVSMAQFVQFYIRYGCRGPVDVSDWSEEYLVLLQYSSNGGVYWNDLMKIHHSTEDAK